MNEKYTIIKASSNNLPMVGMRLDEINFQDKPWLSYITIPYSSSGEGLPSDEESKRLDKIEDLFLETVNSLLVVRINYSGNRELYIHSEELINLKELKDIIENNNILVQISFDPDLKTVKSYF